MQAHPVKHLRIPGQSISSQFDADRRPWVQDRPIVGLRYLTPLPTFPAVGFADAICEVVCQAIVLGQQRRSHLQDRFGPSRFIPRTSPFLLHAS